MRRYTLAANWKMNQSLDGLSKYFKQFSEAVDAGKIKPQVELIFAAPFTLLASTCDLLKNTAMRVSAQNAHWEAKGAFTGEVSLGMLRELGVTTVILGHSERRQFFGETNSTVGKKVAACLREAFTPILCVGETLAERKEGATNDVVREQLDVALQGITQPGKLMIAYEPVWAIGTGLAATAIQAEEVHLFIRDWLTQKWGRESAARIAILYGGSMKADNTRELLAQPNIDGGLVGGASLDPLSFADMAKIASNMSL